MINQKIDFSIGKTISILVVFYTIRKKNLWLNTYIYILMSEYKVYIYSIDLTSISINEKRSNN